MLDFNPSAPAPPFAVPQIKPLMPPVWMLSGTPGTGKTRKWIELIAIPNIESGIPVTISVPRLDLADEIAKTFTERGISASVYRGRDADDPQAGPKAKMCREGDRVAAIEGALASVSQKACKTKDAECQFYKICGYQAQQKLKPQAWVITHPLLFRERPTFIPQPGQLCIDEAFWSQSLHGNDRPYSIWLNDLRQQRPIYYRGTPKRLNTGATNDLLEISQRIASAIGRLSFSSARRSQSSGSPSAPSAPSAAISSTSASISRSRSNGSCCQGVSKSRHSRSSCAAARSSGRGPSRSVTSGRRRIRRKPSPGAARRKLLASRRQRSTRCRNAGSLRFRATALHRSPMYLVRTLIDPTCRRQNSSPFPKPSADTPGTA